MAKPKNIFLIRHGESEGNVDYSFYESKPDYTLLLTEKGILQAKKAGKIMKDFIGLEKAMFYVSPLWRTRQTFENIYGSFDPKQVTWREDPRIREQDWGHMRNINESNRIESERDKFGTFYYRIPEGESCADVFVRISDFFNTLYRDFEKEDYPENVIIVTHGTLIRLFLMRWFHWTVEEYEAMSNPKNCQGFHLELEKGKPEYFTGKKPKYILKSDIKKREIPHSPYTYEWKIINPSTTV